MKESDWRIFKEIKEMALENFCKCALKKFEQIAKDEEVNAHDQYLTLYAAVQDEDRRMQRTFDGHSRSSAPFQLLGIRSAGLADEAMINRLSAAFRQDTDPKKYG